ncbi:MAG: VWA domain-containing protein [Verrucomicrobiales bacterium]|nr:VWA domain-containing protein [Verrucomicrobiales bacterium]
MRIQAASHRQIRRVEARERSRRASVILTVFGISAGLVLVGGIGMGLLTLVEYYKEPEAVFEAVPKKQIKIPPKTPEHKMNVAKHEASRPKPTFTQKLMSTKPSEFALPDLPQVNLDQMLPLDPSELVTDQVSSLMGTSGMGNGMGNSLLGSGGSGTGMSFMGIDSEGSRIMLIFDVSASVVNKAEKIGVPFSKIRDETSKLIEGLPLNARFGLIQFIRDYKPFKDELVVATSGNKKLAQQWIEDSWSDSGSRLAAPFVDVSPNGIEVVLKFAFSLEPDVIFLISDASFQRSPDNLTVPHEDIDKLLKELQEKSGVMGGVKFNFIGFGMKDEDLATMKKIVRRNGGKIKQIE